MFATGVRRNDLYTGRGASGARASRLEFDRALTALEKGDTLVVTTLDRLGRSMASMFSLAAELRGRDINLNVLNLGGGRVDTATPMGGMAFTVMVLTVALFDDDGVTGFGDGLGMETPHRVGPGGAFVVMVTAWSSWVPGGFYSLDSVTADCAAA